MLWATVTNPYMTEEETNTHFAKYKRKKLTRSIFIPVLETKREFRNQ